jgi:hypothetical protein
MAIAIGRIFAIAASVAIVVGLLVPTSAWIFYEDDRRPSHSVMVGRLEVKLPQGTASGTAALVDECGILTNFHVVFGPWYVTTFRAPSREFWGTFTLTEAMLPDGTHPSARAIPVTWGEYLGPDRQSEGAARRICRARLFDRQADAGSGLLCACRALTDRKRGLAA